MLEVAALAALRLRDTWPLATSGAQESFSETPAPDVAATFFYGKDLWELLRETPRSDVDSPSARAVSRDEQVCRFHTINEAQKVDEKMTRLPAPLIETDCVLAGTFSTLDVAADPGAPGAGPSC